MASAAKAMPVDFGVDELRFTLAFALIAWRRPGLLRALYREAHAGKQRRADAPATPAEASAGQPSRFIP